MSVEARLVDRVGRAAAGATAPKLGWSPPMSTAPDPCVGVCVNVSRFPSGTMEGTSATATRQAGAAVGQFPLRAVCRWKGGCVPVGKGVWAVYYKQIRKSEQRPPLHLRAADLVAQPRVGKEVLAVLEQ